MRMYEKRKLPCPQDSYLQSLPALLQAHQHSTVASCANSSRKIGQATPYISGNLYEADTIQSVPHANGYSKLHGKDGVDKAKPHYVTMFASEGIATQLLGVSWHCFWLI